MYFTICKAQWLGQVWKGNVKLPRTEERLKEAAIIPEIGSLKIDRHFHNMPNAQWQYDDDLAKEANFEPIPRTIKELYRVGILFKKKFFCPFGVFSHSRHLVVTYNL